MNIINSLYEQVVDRKDKWHQSKNKKVAFATNVNVKSYRCSYKWIARKNGKDKPKKPSFCPKCKTWMWDIERKNDMSSFHRWQIIHHAAKGMIWNESGWKKPTNEEEKKRLDEIINSPPYRQPGKWLS